MTTRDKLVEAIADIGYEDRDPWTVADKIIAAFPSLGGGLTDEERKALERVELYDPPDADLSDDWNAAQAALKAAKKQSKKRNARPIGK